MSTSITLKNIPEPLYKRIRMSADRHHRSLNSEIIARLEQSLAPHATDVDETLRRVRTLRERYAGPPLTSEEIEAAVNLRLPPRSGQ